MSNKIYTVMKDGEELEKLKTLTAAKKLADAERAEVYTDGKCVYSASTPGVESDDAAETAVSEDPDAEDNGSEQPIPAKDELNPSKYRLKAWMNVREKPSMSALILGTKPEGDIVKVAALENDWLRLTDGTYILFGNGNYAEKIG